MRGALRRRAWERGGDRWEYCGLHQRARLLSFHVEHIVPRQHGGTTSAENLALACTHCTLHKGPNLTGLDPDTSKVTPLFHPRRDVWRQHFHHDGECIEGLTATGRTTVWVLNMNSENQLRLRLAARQLP